MHNGCSYLSDQQCSPPPLPQSLTGARTTHQLPQIAVRVLKKKEKFQRLITLASARLHVDVAPPPALPSLDAAPLQVFGFFFVSSSQRAGLDVMWMLSNHQAAGSLSIFESSYPCRQTSDPCRRQAGSSSFLRGGGQPPPLKARRTPEPGKVKRRPRALIPRGRRRCTVRAHPCWGREGEGGGMRHPDSFFPPSAT